MDVLVRLKKVLPAAWFPDESPDLDAILGGAATVALHGYDMLSDAKKQSRISTSAGGWLDLLAFDFFGLRFRRKGRSDAAFRAAIIAEITRERATRRGVDRAVEDLTGKPATVFELFNPYDTGGLDTPYLGFDEIGRWGDLTPFQFFVEAVQPTGAGIPDTGGLDELPGGLDTSPGMLGALSFVRGAVTQSDIFATIEDNRAAGVRCWAQIGPMPVDGGRLDRDFILDQTPLE